MFQSVMARMKAIQLCSRLKAVATGIGKEERYDCKTSSTNCTRI
jgi:hypothetical protein